MTLTARATVLLASLLLPLAEGHAQGLDSREAIQLQNQIAEIRRDLAQLRDRVASAPAAAASGSALGAGASRPPASAGTNEITASLLERVMALEADMRTLRGRVESQGNALERFAADTKKGLDDLDYRLQQIGTPSGGKPAGGAAAGAAAAGAGVAALPVPPAQPPAPAKPSADAILKEARDALAARDYPAAERAGRRFTAEYPRDARRQEAMLVVGESLYARRDFGQAALVFDDAFRAGTSGPRAAEARVRTGEALASMNEKTAACQALDSAASQFSDMKPELRARLVAARQKAACR